MQHNKSHPRTVRGRGVQDVQHQQDATLGSLAHATYDSAHVKPSSSSKKKGSSKARRGHRTTENEKAQLPRHHNEYEEDTADFRRDGPRGVQKAPAPPSQEPIMLDTDSHIAQRGRDGEANGAGHRVVAHAPEEERDIVSETKGTASEMGLTNSHEEEEEEDYVPVTMHAIDDVVASNQQEDGTVLAAQEDHAAPLEAVVAPEKLVELIESGHAPTTEELKNTYSIFGYTKDGKLPLVRAVVVLNVRAVERLLEAGVDANQTEPRSGMTALHAAVSLPLCTSMKPESRATGRDNTRTSQERSVTSGGVGRNATISRMVKMLLSTGATVNLVDWFGQPLLFTAVTMPFFRLWQRSSDDIPKLKLAPEVHNLVSNRTVTPPDSPSQFSIDSSARSSVHTANTEQSSDPTLSRRVRRGGGIPFRDSEGSSKRRNLFYGVSDLWVDALCSWGQHPLDLATEAVASALVAIRPVVFSQFFLNLNNAMDMSLGEWIALQKGELQRVLRCILRGTAYRESEWESAPDGDAEGIFEEHQEEIHNLENLKSTVATRIISGVAVLDRLSKSLENLVGDGIQQKDLATDSQMEDTGNNDEESVVREGTGRTKDESIDTALPHATQNQEEIGSNQTTETGRVVEDIPEVSNHAAEQIEQVDTEATGGNLFSTAKEEDVELPKEAEPETSKSSGLVVASVCQQEISAGGRKPPLQTNGSASNNCCTVQ
eukprot:gb/GECG01009978.1/.p1 GENE.gb/GECG01009978.1/~~gb/GECG01009978.1/.p1  ORF type:complete len:715 (+),score=114.81 gb/GECG01009978.1/:1-2145(+)